MTARRYRLALLALCVVTTDRPLTAQVVGTPREAVTIEVSATATRRLGNALELIAAADWEAALTALDELQTAHANQLVEVEPRRSINAAIAAQVLRTQLPPDGLAILRRRIDATAHARLAEAQVVSDPALVEQIVAQFPASAAGADAVATLAEWAWERGDLDDAAAAWSLLITSPTNTEISAATPLRIVAGRPTAGELAARHVLLELFDQDPARATELFDHLRDEFPDATGALAGQEVNLLKVLTSLKSNAPTRDISIASRNAWQANGGIARSASRADRVRFIGPIWTTRLEPPLAADVLTTQPMLQSEHSLSLLPAVDGDRVFLQGPTSIRALHLRDGTPLWPTGDGLTSGAIWTAGASDRVVPEQPVLGTPLCAPSLDAGRLLALTGWPISILAEREPRAIDSRIICLDVDRQEGKLQWTRTCEDVLPSAWRFSGPPLAADGRAYIATRSVPPGLALGIVCLDARTGERLWFQTICGLLDESPANFHRITCDLLSASMGRVFWSGDDGATACLDGATGMVQWITLDAPLPWRGNRGLPETRSTPRPAVCHRGRIFAVQQDDQTVQALDLWTGATVWRRELPTQVDQLVGVRGGMVIASGAQLWGLDVDSGDIRWRFGFDDVEGAAAGAALIAGQSVLWPLHEEIFEVDLLTGIAVNRIDLQAACGCAGGNLALADNGLLIAGSTQLTACRLVSNHGVLTPAAGAAASSVDAAAGAGAGPRGEK